ncbi:unnamed protein product [Pedinophyceae sp. YPF-701]|nr:unnamed protein product [Pedinophyceae sp. YPF-701]
MTATITSAERKGKRGNKSAAAPGVKFSTMPFASVASATLATKSAPRQSKSTMKEVMGKAAKRALGGGLPGAAAMAANVLSLMWLRTTVNYQYRYGTSTAEALRTLYAEGGIPRFYQGLAPALIQGPLSRFCDTASNAGMVALLDDMEATRDLPVFVKTIASSAAAAGCRIMLMPVDACKTIMQVEGKTGMKTLAGKVAKSGPTVLYHGAIAASVATFVGHYPWFFVYNALNARLPQYEDMPRRLGRSALIGFCASAVSDTCSNSIRVIKTTKQTSADAKGYVDVVKMVIEKDGLAGLFGRGLKTKILANGLQGLLFSVFWRLGMDAWAKAEAKKEAQKSKRF